MALPGIKTPSQEKVMALLDAMPQWDRHEVMFYYCHSCGVKEQRKGSNTNQCYCGPEWDE
jgi:hypothetical protein